MIEKKDANNLKKYFVFSYLLFWLLLALTGFLISLEVPLLLQNIMKNISAASPTFVILIMFKKLYPNITFKEYLKSQFMKKINPMVFLISLILQASLVVIVVLVFFKINNKPLNTMTFISASAIIPVLIMDLTSGALGEELGWRGYALNILQKKYIPLVASLIVGVIWGLWHLPLMILSGYSGLDLVYYIIAFMVAVVSLSIIITFFYNKSKNILIAMWIHFWFNFLLKLVIIDLLPLLIYLSVGYLILAILVIIFGRKELLQIERQTR
ncbi:MAG: CPBP family intramembrane metalloprotease [Bacteroidetes bacterium]|nr:CPBP family intramembrane metalloprotease [Bacteroidota bacterium]